MSLELPRYRSLDSQSRGRGFESRRVHILAFPFGALYLLYSPIITQVSFLFYYVIANIFVLSSSDYLLNNLKVVLL